MWMCLRTTNFALETSTAAKSYTRRAPAGSASTKDADTCIPPMLACADCLSGEDFTKAQHDTVDKWQHQVDTNNRKDL